MLIKNNLRTKFLRTYRGTAQIGEILRTPSLDRNLLVLIKKECILISLRLKRFLQEYLHQIFRFAGIYFLTHSTHTNKWTPKKFQSPKSKTQKSRVQKSDTLSLRAFTRFCYRQTNRQPRLYTSQPSAGIKNSVSTFEFGTHYDTQGITYKYIRNTTSTWRIWCRTWHRLIMLESFIHTKVIGFPLGRPRNKMNSSLPKSTSKSSLDWIEIYKTFTEIS